ncbi:hypothetical protein PENTCL1PPCAC_10546, partial [Pristionchus entomophagus]
DLEKMGEKTRNMIIENKQLNETVANLNKRLLDAELRKEDQLKKNNEEVLNMKIALEGKEYENKKVGDLSIKDLQSLRQNLASFMCTRKDLTPWEYSLTSLMITLLSCIMLFPADRQINWEE